MTLVYAKIIGMFVCGAEPGGRGWGGGWTRGYLKLFTSDCGRHIAVGRDGGVGVRQWWGWGGWWGRGMGRGFNQSFEQNRYRYIEFGCHYAHYETKSAKNRDFEGVSPILAGNPHRMTSQSRWYVIISPKKSPKMRMWEISWYCTTPWGRREAILIWYFCLT